MARHNETGELGEALVASMFYEVGISVSTASERADLRIEGAVDIEVKTARPSFYKSGGYRGFQFSLERDGHSSLTADVLVLVALHDDDKETAVFFVIPVHVVAGRKKLCIPSTDALAYAGRWAQYRGRWDLIPC